MDLVLAGQTDALVSQLAFELPKTAKYASERRRLSSFPSGASQFSPTNGVKTMRFVISGEQGWVDPGTLRLAFKVQNLSADAELKLAGGAHVLFDEVRLLCSGQEVERITQYGRTHELFRSLFQSYEWNQNEGIEDGRIVDRVNFPRTTAKTINRGSTLSFNMTPMLGFMSSGRYLPIRYAPLEIHFTLPETNALDTVANSPSRQYAITQAEMRYSAVRLDSSLENGIASALLQKKRRSRSIFGR